MEKVAVGRFKAFGIFPVRLDMGPDFWKGPSNSPGSTLGEHKSPFNFGIGVMKPESFLIDEHPLVREG